MVEVDFIIVGQGLAGSTLAYQLTKLGKKIAVFDSQNTTSASMIAAGIYNPITGRNMVKTWNADNIFPYVEKYYTEIEKITNRSFLNNMGIYRPFGTIEEQNEWMARTVDEDYVGYVNKIYSSSKSSDLHDSLGGIEIGQSGFLDVKEYLKAMDKLLSQKNVLKYAEVLDVDALEIKDNGIAYKGLSAGMLIFCNGQASTEDHYFNWLPFKMVKGEILIIESYLSIKEVINRGVFILSLGKNQFKVGATYDNFDITLTPTSEGRAQIEAKLKELIDVEYAVKDQFAGIRPATRDRMPFIGIHPKYKNIGLFNGLGAKGVSFAPYYSHQFAQHLVNQSALDEEVNISRYFSYYKDSIE